MSHIFNTVLRLNLDHPEDRKAWEYLQQLDKRKYRSYSKAIIASINDHFDREKRLKDDPYLETRQKEDEFLQRIEAAVQRGLQAYAPPNPGTCPQSEHGAPPASPTQESPSVDEDSLAEAIAFIDSL